MTTEELIEKLKEYPGLLVVTKTYDAPTDTYEYWPTDIVGQAKLNNRVTKGIDHRALGSVYTHALVL